MSTAKVAIVTGANKGIGYAIVKGLCEKYNGSVYLTSRDVNRGMAAVAELKKLGLNPLFHQLDANDQTSVDKFKDFITKNHGSVDVLINNAGMAFKIDATESFAVQAEETVNNNYFGLLRVSEAFIPLLGKNARLVNVSSSAGHLSHIPSETLKKRFSDPNLTVADLSKLMNEFIRSAKEDQNIKETWGGSTYRVSKIGVSALTRVHQKILDNETPSRNIFVNSVHPGYVDTDMSSHKGDWTIEQGAAGPLYLALEPHGLKGQYVWKDCTIVDWLAPKTPAPY